MSTSTTGHTRPVVHEVIHLDGLDYVYGRAPLGEYLRRLWQRRHFILTDARARVMTSNQGMLLGVGWLVLRPVLDASVYLVIFGLILQTSRGIENFIGYLIVGIFLFQFTTRSITGGANSLLAGKNLIKNFTFPKAALPVAVVVREVLNLLPTLVAMTVMILLIPPHAKLGPTWLLFPVVLLLQIVLTTGLTLLVARATAKVPDLTHLIAMFTRFWFYGSAVFFSLDRFSDSPELVRVLEINPMFIVLDMSRDLLLYATLPSVASWATLATWCGFGIVVGTVVFWRGEETYGSL